MIAAGFRKRPGQQSESEAIIPGDNIDHGVVMKLWLGPLVGDDVERRSWAEYRDRMMQWFAHDGRRPQGWWRYESPIPWPGLSRARSALWEAGLLEEQEARRLEEEWRREFDHAHEPGFFYCEGPERFLEGRRARVAHFVHCDIPIELVERWAAEREGFSDPAPDAA